MALSSISNRNDYTANGSQSVYAYTFQIDAASDLKVTKRDTLGVETPLVLTTDFTVSGVGEATGGNVTLVAGNLPLNYTLTIRRKQPLTQTTSIRNQGSFFPEAHEKAFDHFVKLSQTLEEQSGRSVKLPETVAASLFNTDLPIGLLGANNVVFGTDPTGTKFVVGPTFAQIALAVTDAQIILSFMGQGFIGETICNINNNQAVAANVVGLLLNAASYRSYEIDLTVYRTFTTLGVVTDERVARQKFLAVYRSLTSTWELVPLAIGGDQDPVDGSAAGVNFSITAGGQVQYTSSNITTGTTATSKVTFRAASMGA